MKENWIVTAQEDGKQYWISRAMAVCALVGAVNSKDGKYYFLVEKRGPGCPDFIGAYCNPCGYLNWDETLAQACIRELYEETGLDLRGKEDLLKLWKIKDSPEDNVRQNVTVRFRIIMPYEELTQRELSYATEERGGEKDEVSELKVISEDEIDNYTWAWNHGELLKELVAELKEAGKE